MKPAAWCSRTAVVSSSTHCRTEPPIQRPSWSRVAAWGESLFVSPGPVPAALHAPLAQIRSASASTPGRVLRALRFVQDEVRYLGVEIGVNSHVPYPPATVMKRRFGDCKDKVLLLMTMLREYKDFYNTHRPHRALRQAAPLRPLPVGVTDLGHLRVQRRDRAGGVIHEYRLVA